MKKLTQAALFSGWLEKTFALKSEQRFWTWKCALGWYLQHGGGTIVETGCQRQTDDWGAGCSTTLFATLLKDHNIGELHSVDITADFLKLAQEVTSNLGIADRLHFHHADGVEFLSNFSQPIHFLYLDSYDWFPNEPRLTECQQHQLRELQAAWPKLSRDAVVLLDDNNLPSGGKTRLSKEYLADQGWVCLLDWQQSVWVRSEQI